jgi:MFS family permease
MRLGMWLMALPALSFGMFNVLIPLRLNELGAGAVKIGGVFLAVVALESVMSPLAGRLSDRRGAVWPARVGLAGGGAMLVFLPLPGAVLPIALVLVLCAPLLGLLWTPAMAILSDAAEAAGIDLAFGFGLSNLAWGAGAAIGGSGGGGLAGATTAAEPYLLLAAAVLVTAATLRAPARARVA